MAIENQSKIDSKGNLLFQQGFGNKIRTLPKLTLGLKTKMGSNQSQTTQKRNKLILGLRKKTNSIQPQNEIGIQTQEKPSSFVFGLNKKHEFIPPEGEESPKDVPSHKHSRIRMPKTVGKLEVNIKISELPNWVETVKHGWQQLYINADGQVVQMTVRPKTWQKLLKANKEYPLWVASITGKMGHRIKNGFELLEPAVQIHEWEPKKTKEE
jgi:hypothetical protein